MTDEQFKRLMEETDLKKAFKEAGVVFPKKEELDVCFPKKNKSVDEKNNIISMDDFKKKKAFEEMLGDCDLEENKPKRR